MNDGLYLLDTSVLLALIRGDATGKAVDQRFQLRSSKTRSFVSIVTHGEIHVLARRNEWGKQKLSTLKNALDNLVTIDIHHQKVLDAYVEIDLHSLRHPDGARNMGKNDLWIAACAKAAGLTLLTTDKDFAWLSPDLLRLEVIETAPPSES